MNNENNILVKVDQNNLVYIDPNSTISNGKAEMRNIQQENLVMYVNLEADLIPRSYLVSNNKSVTTASIASGVFNMMHNKNGTSLDTSWTETYVPNSDGKSYDTSGQQLGIDNVSIKITGTNVIPNVTIKFIDVRGKTLFESPENSPYQAFFHLPWPIFYLTVKGYYGKAIKYRLHLIKFSTGFNSQTGNFEIDTTFVGSTYAYLNDIPLKGILNAPYMFSVENVKNREFVNGKQKRLVNRTSKGYLTLKSVYSEYKKKGLIPNDFPVKTLKELVVSAGRLDKILEGKLFNTVIDPKIMAAINAYEVELNNLETELLSWKTKFVTSEYINDTKYNRIVITERNNSKILYGNEYSLLTKITKHVNNLYSNVAFGKTPLIDGKKLNKINTNLKTISLDSLNETIIKKKYIYNSNEFGININDILIDYYEIYKVFIERRKILETTIEVEMNNLIKSPETKNSFEFDPTIRNIIAVILANADTYIRLHKNVHENAFNVSEERNKLLSKFNTDANKNDNIYPWPEVKKASAGGKSNVLVYPGSYEMASSLNSFNSSLWPEVEFVEEYLSVASYKSDPLTEKEVNPEQIEYIFEKDNDVTNIINVNGFLSVTDTLPYKEKSISSVLYEIVERAKYAMSYIPFNNESIEELSTFEAENIYNAFKDDVDIFNLLKSYINGTFNNLTADNVNHTKILSVITKMSSLSLYDRYPYFQNQLPTVDYIKNANNNDFNIEDNGILERLGNQPTNLKFNQKQLTEVNKFIKNYEPENYRLNIYPFVSNEYLKYIDKSKLYDRVPNDNFLITSNSGKYFLKSTLDLVDYVKNGYVTNLFDNNLLIDNNKINILNTPYFHKQLFNDYLKPESNEKYVGSSYLFLNSLPFVDLDSKITKNGTTVLLSTIFKEIGATHEIPYHMMLKWGAIYHRYKKFITDGIDIINNIEEPIDINLFFDNNINRTYNGVSSLDKNTMGVYPMYQNIFHEIVNSNPFFNYENSNMGSTSGYTESINNNILQVITGRTSFGQTIRYSNVINNNILKGENSLTLLPSNGSIDIIENNYDVDVQSNFRIILDNNIHPLTVFSGHTLPNYNEYFNDITTSEYSITNNKKILDLIAVFKPQILEQFEEEFLKFSSEKLNLQYEYRKYGVKYNSFQKILSEIVTIPINPSISLTPSFIELYLKTTQRNILTNITKDILSKDSVINLTLLNPREINEHVIGSFTKNSNIITNFGKYNFNQLTNDNINLIKLYIGEYVDIGFNYYHKFFEENNIKLSEENILLFRQLIYVYAGYKYDGNTGDFKEYVKNNINPHDVIKLLNDKNQTVDTISLEKRHIKYLVSLLNKISAKVIPNETQTLNIKRSYNDDIIKLELYNYFKSFNDKWVAGNSMGQRTLMEDFLFLDKANKDIGSSAYIDIAKLIPIINSKNENINLYGVLVLLLENTGFDIRPLPSYVNFYGTNNGSKNRKITSAKDVANNIFGTFLEVDYEESQPKIILQYFGPTSKHLEMGDIDRKIRFLGDGVNISSQNNNPIIIAPEVFRDIDLSKSNRAVAFEVSMGDINQNMFKSFDVNQSTIKNTSESFEVIERLGRSSSGSATSQIDIGLMDIYRQASYECSVTSFGNMMIQPTMFFYLKNVPMFRGTYWITEVTHDIKTTGVNTTFKGGRIPMTSLPDPSDSLMASYRPLFDKMVKSASVINDIKNNKTTTEKVEITNDGVYVFDMGTGTTKGETIYPEYSTTKHLIDFNGYNGEKYIQKVTTTNNTQYGNTWLRTHVIEMGSNFDNITGDTVMSITSEINQNKIKWDNIKNSNADCYSIRSKSTSTRINKVHKYTYFYNPNSNISCTVINDYNKNIGLVNSGPSIMEYGISLSASLMKKLGVKSNDVIYFKMNDINSNDEFLEKPEF